MEAILVQAIADAAAEFERLPIIQDAGIIRNILYGGVWQTYHAKITREEKKNGEGCIDIVRTVVQYIFSVLFADVVKNFKVACK